MLAEISVVISVLTLIGGVFSHYVVVKTKMAVLQEKVMHLEKNHDRIEQIISTLSEIKQSIVKLETKLEA